jgi:predicted solute-binding protein
MQNHIGLYVNEYSKTLGSVGMAAIETFLRLGREAGIVPTFTKESSLQI